jgi:hypothetical protein
MRKFLFILLCLPVIAGAQKKNVVNATRVFPKADKIDQFEKAIAAHAQKYHKGDWAWRVYSIETGPDAGGYQFVEGPVSWSSFDSRGTLGQEHTDDWNKNLSIYLTDKTSNIYLVAIDSLSTTQVGNFTDKILVTHTFPRLGYGTQYIDHILKMKKAWEAGKQAVVVYQTAASGKSGYAFVYRLQDGFKEFEDTYRDAFRKRYEMGNGAGSWDAYIQNLRTIMNDESWTEILVLQPKLSSLKK